MTWPGSQSEPYDPHAILASDLAHEVHRVYAAINIRVLHGETWAKCAFCGEPYQLTEKWSDATVCCQAHHAAFAASIEEELAGLPDLFNLPDLGELGRPGANELRHPGPGDADGDGWDP